MYKDYDWSKITTLAWWAGNTPVPDPEVVCFVHSKGARIVIEFGTDLTTAKLSDKTYTTQLVQDALKTVQDNFLDGVNFDFEDAIEKDDAVSRKALSDLMQLLYDTFHNAIPGSQVTFDAGWQPNVDVRFYDYATMAKYTDFLVVMDYDEQSQIFGPCKAGATSDYNYLIKGVNAFLGLGISSDKLVSGLPWYGHDFTCTRPKNITICPLAPAPWRGVNCTDLYAPEYSYDRIMSEFLPRSTTGMKWDEESKSPWFNYVDRGVTHQMWFDNPESIKLKVQWAKDQKIRGVGMFTGDYLNYSNSTQKSAFWDAMNSFFITYL
jgi:di-N-acetylchitobiase